ncbi:MAG: hypothetical protein AAGI13_03075 [Pseudomonadota bacterium]
MTLPGPRIRAARIARALSRQRPPAPKPVVETGARLAHLSSTSLSPASPSILRRILSTRIGTIASVIGVLLAAIATLFQVFGNINVTGHWQAFDPRDRVGIDISGEDDVAYRGCLHLVQKWPSGNFIGTIERDLDELPNLIGRIEADQLKFEFLVFEHIDGVAIPEYGTGTMVQIDYGGGKALSGIWHQVDSIRKRESDDPITSQNEKGRWLLLPSETTCGIFDVDGYRPGNWIPPEERPPFTKWTSLLRWLGVE